MLRFSVIPCHRGASEPALCPLYPECPGCRVGVGGGARESHPRIRTGYRSSPDPSRTMPPCTWVPCIAYGIFTASSDSTKRWRKPLRNKGISRLSLAGRRVAALSTNGDQKFGATKAAPQVRLEQVTRWLTPLRVRNLNADPSASQQKMRAWHRWRWLADAEPEIFRFIEGYYKTGLDFVPITGTDHQTGRSRPVQWCTGRLNQVSTRSGQAQGANVAP